MAPPQAATDEQLIAARDAVMSRVKNGIVRSWQVKDELTKIGVYMDESTIRGRFITTGQPLGSMQTAIATPNVELKVAKPVEAVQPGGAAEVEKKAETTEAVAERVATAEPVKQPVEYPPELKAFIPTQDDIDGYIERDVDKRLSTHYSLGKHPITQGKQGTGKTFSHLYYAFKQQVPFMLVSCFEDLLLHKFFGDKSIKDGTVIFKEGILTKMIQFPSVILFDEINAVGNAKSFDFHALLQNRELFVKDAADGEGKIYKLHPECRIGFAQNPRSSKYIGGTVKPSSFLGRCTYITFPDFQKDEMVSVLKKRFPKAKEERLVEFVDFFVEANNFLMTNGVAVDISIRQLINMVDFHEAGMSVEDSIDDALASVLDAISAPQHKKALMGVATTIFSAMNEDAQESETKIEKMKRELAEKIKAAAIKP